MNADSNLGHGSFLIRIEEGSPIRAPIITDFKGKTTEEISELKTEKKLGIEKELAGFDKEEEKKHIIGTFFIGSKQFDIKQIGKPDQPLSKSVKAEIINQVFKEFIYSNSFNLALLSSGQLNRLPEMNFHAEYDTKNNYIFIKEIPTVQINQDRKVQINQDRKNEIDNELAIKTDALMLEKPINIKKITENLFIITDSLYICLTINNLKNMGFPLTKELKDHFDDSVKSLRKDIFDANHIVENYSIYKGQFINILDEMNTFLKLPSSELNKVKTAVGYIKEFEEKIIPKIKSFDSKDEREAFMIQKLNVCKSWVEQGNMSPEFYNFVFEAMKTLRNLADQKQKIHSVFNRSEPKVFLDNVHNIEAKLLHVISNPMLFQNKEIQTLKELTAFLSKNGAEFKEIHKFKNLLKDASNILIKGMISQPDVSAKDKLNALKKFEDQVNKVLPEKNPPKSLMKRMYVSLKNQFKSETTPLSVQQVINAHKTKLDALVKLETIEQKLNHNQQQIETGKINYMYYDLDKIEMDLESLENWAKSNNHNISADNKKNLFNKRIEERINTNQYREVIKEQREMVSSSIKKKYYPEIKKIHSSDNSNKVKLDNYNEMLDGIRSDLIQNIQNKSPNKIKATFDVIKVIQDAQLEISKYEPFETEQVSHRIMSNQKYFEMASKLIFDEPAKALEFLSNVEATDDVSSSKEINNLLIIALYQLGCNPEKPVTLLAICYHHTNLKELFLDPMKPFLKNYIEKQIETYLKGLLELDILEDNLYQDFLKLFDFIESKPPNDFSPKISKLREDVRSKFIARSEFLEYAFDSDKEFNIREDNIHIKKNYIIDLFNPLTPNKERANFIYMLNNGRIYLEKKGYLVPFLNCLNNTTERERQSFFIDQVLGTGVISYDETSNLYVLTENKPIQVNVNEIEDFPSSFTKNDYDKKMDQLEKGELNKNEIKQFANDMAESLHSYTLDLAQKINIIDISGGKYEDPNYQALGDLSQNLIDQLFPHGLKREPDNHRHLFRYYLTKKLFELNDLLLLSTIPGRSPIGTKSKHTKFFKQIGDIFSPFDNFKNYYNHAASLENYIGLSSLQERTIVGSESAAEQSQFDHIHFCVKADLSFKEPLPRDIKPDQIKYPVDIIFGVVDSPQKKLYDLLVEVSLETVSFNAKTSKALTIVLSQVHDNSTEVELLRLTRGLLDSRDVSPKRKLSLLDGLLKIHAVKLIPKTNIDSMGDKGLYITEEQFESVVNDFLNSGIEWRDEDTDEYFLHNLGCLETFFNNYTKILEKKNIEKQLDPNQSIIQAINNYIESYNKMHPGDQEVITRFVTHLTKFIGHKNITNKLGDDLSALYLKIIERVIEKADKPTLGTLANVSTLISGKGDAALRIGKAIVDRLKQINAENEDLEFSEEDDDELYDPRVKQATERYFPKMGPVTNLDNVSVFDRDVFDDSRPESVYTVHSTGSRTHNDGARDSNADFDLDLEIEREVDEGESSDGESVSSDIHSILNPFESNESIEYVAYKDVGELLTSKLNQLGETKIVLEDKERVLHYYPAEFMEMKGNTPIADNEIRIIQTKREKDGELYISYSLEYKMPNGGTKSEGFTSQMKDITQGKGKLTSQSKETLFINAIQKVMSD